MAKTIEINGQIIVLANIAYIEKGWHPNTTIHPVNIYFTGEREMQLHFTSDEHAEARIKEIQDSIEGTTAVILP